MKRLSILASMLMALIAFTACSTNRDDNPVLSLPEDGSFVLYAPGISANTIDLDNSTSLTFKVDQPNYGYTAHITYMMEFAASEDGSTWSEWQTTETSNEDPLAITVPTSEIAGAVTSALVELGREEVDFPLTAKVKARVHAYLSGKEETTSVYSNEVILTATTSYVLPPVPSLLFYIVGAQPGWSGAEAITAVLYPEGGDVYTYTTKFTGAWDLKIWAEEDAITENWDGAYGCEVDGDNSPEGAIINVGAQAISSPTAEYYTFTFDKHHMSYSWTKLENQEPTEYSSISLIGNWTDDWSNDVDMTQVTPHNWYVEHTFTNDDVEFKFRANHDWGTNWGAAWTVSSEQFSALGVGGGDNIKCAKGTYRFYINDITSKICVVPVVAE
ncbi:MAG: SusE domain-containing protein [Prevotella sp.]|nr:SusE domain-containing protein [Prevotella sp.]MBQ7414871.1 SusE domain-containing protein [Prevotella sp.]